MKIGDRDSFSVWPLIVVLWCSLILGDPAWADERPPVTPWEPIARIEHPDVVECSGIAASRQYDGIFWIHNDSGNGPYIFAVKLDGSVVAKIRIDGASCIDWEDIATDDEGHLYIADIGNNLQVFPQRTIYRIKEPNPLDPTVESATVTARYKYKFPEDRFDAEGLIARDGYLWLVSKQRGSTGSLYLLERNKGTKWKPSKQAPLRIVGATGADVSRDGKLLAVCNGRVLQVYVLDEAGLPQQGVEPLAVRFPNCAAEAVCFTGEDLILVTEPGAIYRVTMDQLKAGTRFSKPRTATPPAQP